MGKTAVHLSAWAPRYLEERFPDAEAWQVSLDGDKDVATPEGVRICPAERWLAGLV